MPEVTKKDLQSLQGHCNRQIDDVKKQIDAANSAIKNAEEKIDKLNVGLCKKAEIVEKQMVTNWNSLDKRISALEFEVAKLK